VKRCRVRLASPNLAGHGGEGKKQHSPLILHRLQLVHLLICLRRISVAPLPPISHGGFKVKVSSAAVSSGGEAAREHFSDGFQRQDSWSYQTQRL
jgi:hypothetical protein